MKREWFISIVAVCGLAAVLGLLSQMSYSQIANCKSPNGMSLAALTITLGLYLTVFVPTNVQDPRDIDRSTNESMIWI